MNASAVRFLISGYYGFGNLGDEALLEVIVEQLRTRFPYAEITALSQTPEATARQFRIRSVARMDLRAVGDAVKNSDVVLSGGGGLLQNRTSLTSLLYYVGLINGASRSKKTMIFAQSIGPLDSLGRRIVGKLCRRVAAATVRDARSRELLQSLLPKIKVEQTADPVFLYEPPAVDLTHLLPPALREYQGEVALISLRRSTQTEKVTKRVAQAVDQLAQRGVLSVFVPLGGAADAEVSTTVIRRCRAKPMLLPETDLPGTYALLQRCRVVIGMRLHALILAARANRPFLALPYDPKVSALCEDLEYPLPPLWTPDAKDVLPEPADAINRLLDERETLAGALATGTAKMQAAAARNFALIETLI